MMKPLSSKSSLQLQRYDTKLHTELLYFFISGKKLLSQKPYALDCHLPLISQKWLHGHHYSSKGSWGGKLSPSNPEKKNQGHVNKDRKNRYCIRIGQCLVYTSSRFCITRIWASSLAETGLLSMLGWGREADGAKLTHM